MWALYRNETLTIYKGTDRFYMIYTLDAQMITQLTIIQFSRYISCCEGLSPAIKWYHAADRNIAHILHNHTTDKKSNGGEKWILKV